MALTQCSVSHTLVNLFSFVTSYLDFLAQKQTGVPDWCGFPKLRVVRQHLQLNFYPFIQNNCATVTQPLSTMWLRLCVCVSVFCSCIWGLGVRFHPDSRGSRGGGPNICSEGQEQKHWHVSLFTEMTFPPLPIPASLPAAVLLSASLPQAQLKSSARISPRLPKSPLTKCQDYIFLCSHWGL